MEPFQAYYLKNSNKVGEKHHRTRKRLDFQVSAVKKPLAKDFIFCEGNQSVRDNPLKFFNNTD